MASLYPSITATSLVVVEISTELDFPVDLAVNTKFVPFLLISTTSDNFFSPAVTSFNLAISSSADLKLSFKAPDISNVVPSTFILALILFTCDKSLATNVPVVTLADAASVILELELDPAPPFNNF